LISHEKQSQDPTGPKTAVFGIDLLDETSSAEYDNLQNYANKAVSFVDTRTTAPLFTSSDNQLALYATAMAEWQRRTKHCARCGGPVALQDGATSAQCTRCKTKSWPRQDPSMIAVISSRDGQRVLLGHAKRHPPKLYTVLAGFVEAGETFEAAVARETFEETGVCIDEGSTKYIGSQPWPFPQSCMVGFTATADDNSPLVVDPNELEHAAWFDRADVAQAATVTGSTMQRAVAEAALANDPSLPLLIPPKGVIARKLIDLWLEDKPR
jgi:NAD+ diphosphatase